MQPIHGWWERNDSDETTKRDEKKNFDESATSFIDRAGGTSGGSDYQRHLNSNSTAAARYWVHSSTRHDSLALTSLIRGFSGWEIQSSRLVWKFGLFLLKCDTTINSESSNQIARAHSEKSEPINKREFVRVKIMQVWNFDYFLCGQFFTMKHLNLVNKIKKNKIKYLCQLENPDSKK